MRHRKDGRQFGRNTSHRRAMFRNLAANLVNHERIVTTEAKAKELRRVADRLISKAKRLGPVAYTPHDKLSAEDRAKRLHVSRLLSAFVPRWGVDADGDKRDLVEKILIELSQRFAERPGGYTRIIKLGPRKGDGAAMSVIEFVDAQPFDDDEPVEAEGEATIEAPPPAEKPKKAKAKKKAAEEEAEADEAEAEEKAEEEEASADGDEAADEDA